MPQGREQGAQVPVFTADRTWVHQGLEVLTATVSLPSPEGEGAAGRIRRYYRAQCRAFFRYCEKTVLPLAIRRCDSALSQSRPLPRLQAELSSTVTYHGGGVLSLYTQTKEPAEEGLPLLRRWGDTWDLRRGALLCLGDLPPPERGWRRSALAAAEGEIARQERQGTARYLPDWRRRLRRHFSPLRFYLTAQGTVFFYPMYALAGAQEGVPSFTVPAGDAPP